ncbi:MAG: hypothetical protein GY819_02545 [Planctomycetaceae bacterium]|nr:hypothetical protein [Planctomycetaceae bacterium]
MLETGSPSPDTYDIHAGQTVFIANSGHKSLSEALPEVRKLNITAIAGKDGAEAFV